MSGSKTRRRKYAVIDVGALSHPVPLIPIFLRDPGTDREDSGEKFFAQVSRIFFGR